MVSAASKSKLKCLFLPAQSGKTRKVEEEIKKFKLIHELFGNGDINIVISANNKLLVHQTTSRIKKDLGTDDSDDEESNAVIKGNIFSWTSGSKKTNITSKELAFEIANETIEMVILCANGTRIRYLNDMLTILSNCRFFKKRINIWIDEADKTINSWIKYPMIIEMAAVNQVTLVSATFYEVIKRLGRINVLPYQETMPSCYRRLIDCNRIIVDFVTTNSANYVKHVLEKRPKLITAGLRAFIPGDYSCASHEEISALLLEYGFAVLILNGTKKELRIPCQEPIDLRPFLKVSDPDKLPDEFNSTLSRLYIENDLKDYPFAITGFLCVERGVTFQCAPGVQCNPQEDHDGFLFDYGIIPPIADKSEAYQTMARLFGNIGDFLNYKPSTIYSTSNMFKKVGQSEETAVNLARLVHEQDSEDVGPEHFHMAANYETERKWILLSGEFDTREEANEFLVDNGSNANNRAEEMEGEFIKSSMTELKAVLSYSDVQARLSISKTSLFDVNKNPDKKQHSRMIICYKDIEDPSTVTYIVRILKAGSTESSRQVKISSGNPFD
jgi:hypothetical protein